MKRRAHRKHDGALDAPLARQPDCAFDGGRVAWKNRWVRTEKYALERAAGKSLLLISVDVER